MAFTGSTFGLFNDSGLTSAFGGTLSVVNYTDLSDNPQDFTLYIGSNTAARQLQANSDPGVDDITLTPIDNTSEWVLSTVYTLGQMRQPTTPNGLVYIVTTAGTSDTTEPTWPTTGLGSTVVDGTVIWSLYAAHHAATEIKLALDSGDLAAAVGGDPLAIGPVILSSVVEAIPIYIRITNAVTTVSNNTGREEVAIQINQCLETGTV